MILNCTASGLLKIHQDSLCNALKFVYPEEDWHFWKFSQVPKGTWDIPGNQEEFFHWITKKLDIQQPSDWLRWAFFFRFFHVTCVDVCRVSTSELKALGGEVFLSKNGGLQQILCKYYSPEEAALGWASNYQISKKRQNALLYALKNIFPSAQGVQTNQLSNDDQLMTHTQQ
jgi:hypothetical protein